MMISEGNGMQADSMRHQQRDPQITCGRNDGNDEVRKESQYFLSHPQEV